MPILCIGVFLSYSSPSQCLYLSESLCAFMCQPVRSIQYKLITSHPSVQYVSVTLQHWLDPMSSSLRLLSHTLILSAKSSGLNNKGFHKTIYLEEHESGVRRRLRQSLTCKTVRFSANLTAGSNLFKYDESINKDDCTLLHNWFLYCVDREKGWGC